MGIVTAFLIVSSLSAVALADDGTVTLDEAEYALDLVDGDVVHEIGGRKKPTEFLTELATALEAVQTEPANEPETPAPETAEAE